MESAAFSCFLHVYALSLPEAHFLQFTHYVQLSVFSLFCLDFLNYLEQV